MPKETKKIAPINYLSKEFVDIRSDLIQLAQRYYPDQFQDFSESSFGAMMVDAVAYVGDQLSLYLDYNVNESFLDTAFDKTNIVRHGRILGYKTPGRSSTYGKVALYIMVPADSAGIGPDTRYIPQLQRGSSFGSDTGLNFILTENVNFNDPANDFIVARTDASSGAPTYYAIKTYGNVVSGHLGVKSISIGAFEKFKRVKLGTENIVEIISVFDTEGNEYFEVDYLAQDMIYKELENKNFQDDNVPSILKPMLVSRKFVVERSNGNVILQFGSGEEGASNVIANPQNVAMDIFGKTYVTDTTFDPTRISKNSNFGIVPSNTTLMIAFRTTNPQNSNVATKAINTVSNSNFQFVDPNTLSVALTNTVQASLEVSNETPIVGNVSNPSAGEIKRRIFDTFPTQNRAVTQADYENLAYRMPAKFGSVKRVSCQKDQDSLKRNLNMYIISEDSFGKLTPTNSTIKNNLKTWLSNYRMINDTIDILDPYIINLGIEFVIKVPAGTDKNAALESAYKTLKEKFSEGFFIAEQLYISDVYSELKKDPRILDVVKVKIVNKTSGQYSSAAFNVDKNLSPDGSYLMAPQNAVFEIKFPDADIKGKVR
jgi:hypothetical protein